MSGGETPVPAPGFRLRFPQVDREVRSRAGETLQGCARRHGQRIIFRTRLDGVFGQKVDPF